MKDLYKKPINNFKGEKPYKEPLLEIHSLKDFVAYQQLITSQLKKLGLNLLQEKDIQQIKESQQASAEKIKKLPLNELEQAMSNVSHQIEYSMKKLKHRFKINKEGEISSKNNKIVIYIYKIHEDLMALMPILSIVQFMEKMEILQIATQAKIKEGEEKEELASAAA